MLSLSVFQGTDSQRHQPNLDLGVFNTLRSAVDFLFRTTFVDSYQVGNKLMLALGYREYGKYLTFKKSELVLK